MPRNNPELYLPNVAKAKSKKTKSSDRFKKLAALRKAKKDARPK